MAHLCLQNLDCEELAGKIFETLDLAPASDRPIEWSEIEFHSALVSISALLEFFGKGCSSQAGGFCCGKRIGVIPKHRAFTGDARDLVLEEPLAFLNKAESARKVNVGSLSYFPVHAGTAAAFEPALSKRSASKGLSGGGTLVAPSRRPAFFLPCHPEARAVCGPKDLCTPRQPRL